MESAHMLSYIVAGQLRRDFILPITGKPSLDVPGGSLLYAAVGLAVWDKHIGLVARVGEDFPQNWLEECARRGFDRRGIRVLPTSLDLRRFIAFPSDGVRQSDGPVAHFANRGLPFPPELLDYTAPAPGLDSRTRLSELSIRIGDLPADYLDATCAHLCPLDYLTHSMLPSALRQGHTTTITLDPSPGYMDPTFWDDVPAIVTGLTAFLTSEEKLRNLFQGRSDDLWEMAETIAGYGCELVVIKRGERGQCLYNHANHTRWNIPAYPARVVDPTGAGDAFCGGFLAGYHLTFDPLEAALYGNISASLVIENSGAFYAMDSLPGLAQARLTALREMAQPA